jgi:hypothetical protein
MKLNKKLDTCYDLRALNILTECDARIKNKMGWSGHTIEIYGYEDEIHVMELIKKITMLQKEFALFDPSPSELHAGISVCVTVQNLIADYEISLKNTSCIKKIACRIADFFQCFFCSTKRRTEKLLQCFEFLERRGKKDYHLQIAKMFN